MKKNKGAAMARNKGIDLVKGNYIAFFWTAMTFGLIINLMSKLVL